MDVQIYYKTDAAAMGKLKILPDNYELQEVKNSKHKKVLTDFLEVAYARGIKYWNYQNEMQETPLQATDHRFPLVLAEKLLAMGYVLRK